jgi:WD40 repeat protein
VHLHDSPETRESLLSVLAANRGVIAPSRRQLPGLVAADTAGGRLVAYRDGRLSIHDPVTLEATAQSAPVPAVRSWSDIELDPDGIELAVIHGADDPVDPEAAGAFAHAPLVLYDSRTLRPMAGQPGGIPPFASGLDIAYSADGRFVAASFSVFGDPGDAEPSSSPIFVWDRSAPDIPVATVDSGAPRNRVALSPDGSRLNVAATPPGDVHTFDVASGEIVATASGVGSRLSASSDGTMLAATGAQNDGGITILDPTTLTELTRLEARVNTSLSIPSFSHDGSRVAAAAWDETVVYEWDIETGERTEVLVGQSAFLEGVWFDPDDGTVHAAGDDDSLIGWDLVDGRRFVRRTPPPAGQRPADLPLPLDHQRVVYVNGAFGSPEDGGTLQVRDLAAGHLAERFDVGHDVVFAAAWRPDGERIATTGLDGVVRVWEAATGDLLLEREVGGIVGALFYDRDGDRIVVGEEAGSLYTLDAETLEPAGDPFDTGESLFTVAPGPADGTAIVIPSDPSDTTVSIVDVRGARLLHELDAGFVAFNAAASPDGGRVAFGGAHGELRIFELGRMEWLGPPVVATGADIQSSIAWSSDGRTIVTGSEAGVVALWDAESGASVGTFAPEPNSGAVATTFVGDSSTVLVLAADGSTSTWDSDPTSWIDLACAVAGRELTPEEWKDALGERPYEETCPQR